MNLMPIVSEFTTVRAALASLVLIGRILLLAAALRRRLETVRDGRARPRPPATETERTVVRLIAAAQTAGAVLAILEWLAAVGIIQLW